MAHKDKDRLKKINETLGTIPISSWDWPKVAVYVPLERSISHADWVFPWVVGIAQQGVPFIQVGYEPVDKARNRAASELLKSDLTHIIMLDIDHVHPVNIVQRLAKWFLIDDSFQIVGGLNFRRGAPHDPCCSIYQDGQWLMPDQWVKDKLFEVDVLGTGSIMIAREVFETLDMPWFFKPWDDGRADFLSDDAGFSTKCRDAGIKMYCDPSVTSPHINLVGIDERHYRAHAAAHPDNGEVKDVIHSPETV